MKKLFLTLVVAFAGILSANAQVWMGGSFNFNRLKVNEDADAAFTYGIAPEVGVSIAPRWDVALAIGYQGAHATDLLSFQAATGNMNVSGLLNADEVLNADDYYQNDITFNPYVRYKVFELGKVGFFIDGGFAWNHGVYREKNEEIDNKVKTNEYWFGLKPGVSFAASDNITFAAHIGSFGYDKVEDGASNFGLNVNNSAFTLGLWWSL